MSQSTRHFQRARRAEEWQVGVNGWERGMREDVMLKNASVLEDGEV